MEETYAGRCGTATESADAWVNGGGTPSGHRLATMGAFPTPGAGVPVEKSPLIDPRIAAEVLKSIPEW